MGYGRSSWLWVGLSALGVAIVGSLGAMNTLELTQAAAERVKSAVRDSVGIGMEIDQLQLQVGKLDREMEQDQRTTAREQIALERGEQDLAELQGQQNTDLAKMTQLRNLLRCNGTQVQVGCSTYRREQVEVALKRKLDVYKSREEQLDLREKALAAQRQSCRQLTGLLAEKKHQRDLLAQQVATLRSQLKSLEMSGASSTSTIDETLLQRAKDLSRRIQNRLDEERRAQELGQRADQTEVLLDNLDPQRNVEEEFDRLTAGNTET